MVGRLVRARLEGPPRGVTQFTESNGARFAVFKLCARTLEEVG